MIVSIFSSLLIRYVERKKYIEDISIAVINVNPNKKKNFIVFPDENWNKGHLQSSKK